MKRLFTRLLFVFILGFYFLRAEGQKKKDSLNIIINGQNTGSIEIIDTTLNLKNWVYLSPIECQGCRIKKIYRSYHDSNYTSPRHLFLHHVDFSLAKFQCISNFSFVTFYDTANFAISNFENNVNFSSSLFKKEAFLLGAKFYKNVDFSQSTFKDKISFVATKFQNKAILNNLTLTDSSQFEFINTILPDTIDFSNNPNIKNDIDLSIANFRDSTHFNAKASIYKRHLIRLYKSDISKFNFDYQYFKLDTSGLSDDEKTTQYEALLKNFKDRGRTKSYELLDIEYMRFKYPHWLTFIMYAWWNFGYNKGWVFYWTGGFILFFSLITFAFYNKLNSRAYNIKRLPGNIHRTYFKNLFKYLLVRIWYSIIYTVCIFLLLTLKVENFSFKHWIGVIYVFIVYTLGIVCLAYMANFVLQK